MRLKNLLLQGKQSKYVLASMHEIGVKSLCAAAADMALSKRSEGLALPVTAESRAGAEHHMRVPGTPREVLRSLGSISPEF